MPSEIVLSKRQRLESDSATSLKQNHSRILAPFRSIGHITSPTPFSILPQGRTFQLTTALDTTIQTYDVRKLNLLFVSSPPTPGAIQRIVSHKSYVYAAIEGHGVWLYRRGKKVGELRMSRTRLGAWKELLCFGDWIMGAFEDGMVVWKRESGEVWTEIDMKGGAGSVLAVCHPSAMLNKICVARMNGEIEIWNVKTRKRIYTILPPVPASAKGKSAVTVMVQSSAISILAIGYSTGEVHLHNIITDTPLFTLNAAAYGQRSTASHQKRVVSLSFCTDPSVGAGKESKANEGGGRILAVGDDSGHVTLWNLEKRAVSAVMWNAHRDEGVNVQWLNGQNILITSGADNSVKEWVFDSPHSTLPRILRSRAGHCQSITTLAFVSPATSHFLLSSSLDRTLRSHSLRNDAQTFEFSQGTGVKKATKAAKSNATLQEQISEARAGPITCIATCAGEDGSGSTGRDWEGIVTGHQGERAARSWSFQNKKIGRWTLETTDGTEVKAVAVSACGTFAFVGSASGGIDMFNLESGIHRRRFPELLSKAQAKKVRNGEASGKLLQIGKGKHTKAVTGLHTDPLNRVLISTSLDGTIKFWNFASGVLESEINLQAGAVTKAKLHRPSELLAVSSDDLCIRVLDIVTKKVVRELWGCGGNISDFTFSSDGRWIIAAATDSVIRIWDLPTGHMVDAVRTPSIVTALAFTGTGEFLATAHVDSVGINLWTNRTLFRHVPTRLITDDDIVDLSAPTVSGIGGTGVIEGALAIEPENAIEDGETGVYTSRPDQLAENLLTLSLVPRTRWQTLLNLDLIRARNKPQEAPKAPEKAPFFLGAASAIAPSGQVARLEGIPAITNREEKEEEVSRIRKADLTYALRGGETAFSKHLRTGDHSALVETLKTLPPSAADLEIRNLDGEEEMVAFVEALTERLKTGRDFELVQTWMKVFLKLHGDAVAGEEGGLREALQVWRDEGRREGERLSERVGYCKGLIGFLRSAR